MTIATSPDIANWSEALSVPSANQTEPTLPLLESLAVSRKHLVQETKTGPEYQFKTESLRTIMGGIPSADQQTIKNFLADDLRLENCRAGVLAKNPDLTDRSPELGAHMAATLGRGLTSDTQKALTTLMDFYLGYLRAFPEKSETEPLANLFNYMTDPEKNWTAIMAFDKNGNIVGACSGEVVEVTTSTGTVKIGMNEHAWVDEGLRGQSVGRFVSRQFDEHAKSLDAIGMFAEVENPYLLTTDPRALSDDSVRDRRNYWTADKPEGLGWPIDPFRRLAFWGHDGYGLLCSGNPPVPIPYVQISMQLGEVGCCDVVIPVFKAFKPEYEGGLTKELYRELVVSFQKTIDPDAMFYPELVRTLRQIDEAPGDTLYMLGLNDTQLNVALRASLESKHNCVQADLTYCNERLLDDNLNEAERRVIMGTKAFYEGQTTLAA